MSLSLALFFVTKSSLYITLQWWLVTPFRRTIYRRSSELEASNLLEVRGHERVDKESDLTLNSSNKNTVVDISGES